MIKRFTILIFTALLYNCSQTQNLNNRDDTDIYDINFVKSNLEFLASDELEGREATTEGERIASLFISKELQKCGIKPFGENGTYFQNFNLLKRGIGTSSNLTLYDSSDAVLIRGEFLKEFFRGSRGLPNDSLFNTPLEMVFSGYGITAAEYNYDDYSDINVSGKICVVLSGEPSREDDEDYFMGEKRSRYSRSFSKSITASSKGASALLILPDEYLLSNWDFYHNWSTSPSFSYVEDTSEISSSGSNIPVFIVSPDFGKIILQNELYNFQKIQEFDNTETEMPKYYLNKKAALEINLFSEFAETRNVIGILEGRNPALIDEYVSIGAHYDHLGTSSGVVYNGADDNGSGTVTLLQVAKSLAQVHDNDRSILFIFHTAEEKGLLGAKHFTNTVDYMSDIVVNINLDMVGRESPDSIHCIGSDKMSKELHNLIIGANDKSAKFFLDYKYNDPNDPNRFYWRSDHVHYVRKGVPSVFFFDDMKEDYHKSTDDVFKINFNKIIKLSNLIKEISLEISNLDHRLIIDNE